MQTSQQRNVIRSICLACRYSTQATAPLASTSADPSTLLRQVMRKVAQPVAIITVPLSFSTAEQDTHGATLSSLSSISLSPPIVAFSLRLPSRLAGYLLDKKSGNRSMNIHLLAQEQEELARAFARQLPPIPSTQDASKREGASKHVGFERELFEELERTSLGRLRCRLITSIPLHTLEQDERIRERAREGTEEEAPRSELFLARVEKVDIPIEDDGTRKSLVYKGQGYFGV